VEDSLQLTIIGGTYLECCAEPRKNTFYGSGLRAASALSGKGLSIRFISCVGEYDVDTANSNTDTFGIKASFTIIPQTISFHYYHPLSTPIYEPENIPEQKVHLAEIIAESILFYGMIEADAKVNASYVVYDPQNYIPFKETGSKAQHLAIVLNKKEAYLLSGLSETATVVQAGKLILENESADVVVIKNGPKGAIVIEQSSIEHIPVFQTASVWPIGSGDIFSAVFAWKWMIEKQTAAVAAKLASQYCAHYCEVTQLPLPNNPNTYSPLPLITGTKKIYLAGPFFTIAERWLINEVYRCLLNFDNKVFSPYHREGIIDSLENAKHIASINLKAVEDCDTLFAVLNGLDAGTIFEIGYARQLGKKVIILGENVPENDLTMFIGSDCEIESDLTTAIYKASW
jgi:hypothetical protein